MSSATKSYSSAVINGKMWYFCVVEDECKAKDTTEDGIVDHVWDKHLRHAADTPPLTPGSASPDVSSIHLTNDRLDESSTDGSFDNWTTEEEDNDCRDVSQSSDTEPEVMGRSAASGGQSDTPSVAAVDWMDEALDELFDSTDGQMDTEEEDYDLCAKLYSSVANCANVGSPAMSDQWVADKPFGPYDHYVVSRKRDDNETNGEPFYRCGRADCGRAYGSLGRVVRHLADHRCGYTFDDSADNWMATSNVCRRSNLDRYRVLVPDIDIRYKCLFSDCSYECSKSSSIRDHIHGLHVCPYRMHRRSYGKACRVTPVAPIGDESVGNNCEITDGFVGSNEEDIVDNEEVVLEFEPYSANIAHNKRKVGQTSGSAKKRSMNWHRNNPQVADHSAIDTQQSARSLSPSVHSNDNMSDETFVLTDGPMDVPLDEESVDDVWGQSMDYSLGGDGSSESTLSANSLFNVLDYQTANNMRVSPQKSRSKRAIGGPFRRRYRCDREGCDAAYATLNRYNKHVSYHLCGYRMDDSGGADDPVVNDAGVCGQPNIDRYLEIKVAADGCKWSYCLFNGCDYKTKNSSNCRDHIHTKHICPKRSAGSPVRPISTSITRILAEEPIGGQNDATLALNCAANAVLKNGINSDRKISQEFAMRSVGQTSGSVLKSVAADEWKVKIRPMGSLGNGVHRFNESMD